MMKIIGLTGGIGSGKSTVSEYLKKRGCIIIDADEMSRKMTEKGGAALAAIREAFGDGYFRADGSLDRKKLGATVFADSEKKQLLENIVTKAVIKKTIEEIESLRNADKKGIAVLDAPLLFEFGMQHYTDENWLVTADKALIIDRVKARDGMAEDEILERISNQMPDSDKRALAERIIDNSKDLGYLYEQIAALLYAEGEDD